MATSRARLQALLLAAVAIPAACQDASVSLSITSPSVASASGVSKILTPSFAGMGIEPSNLFYFTGGTETNQLSVNLFRNLANFTGVPPHLRIGGNTGDNMIYDSSHTTFDLVLNPNPSGLGAYKPNEFIFGSTFFQALDRFPAGTPITYGLNLAYEASDYVSKIVAQANAAMTVLTNVELVSFEIGNEPDLYLQNGFRTGTWTDVTYAGEWRARAEAVYNQVLQPAGLTSRFFEPACTASTIGTTFEIVQLDRTDVTTAVSTSSNTSFVAGWNQHDYFYYIGVSGYDITLDILMDLSQTVTQFASWIDQVSQAIATGYPYYLREMASVGPVGLAGISDTFGATLWTLNFFLYTATLNISSVQMHMTENSYAAPWQPTEFDGQPAHVRSTYYAWVAIDQLIGPACTTQVAPLTIPTSDFPADYTNRLAAYAVYRQSTLASLVLLNTRQSNASVSSKPSATFTFTLPSSLAGRTLHLSYLTAPGADSTSDTTFNGLSFEVSSDGTPTIVDTAAHTVTVASDGTVDIPVRDSSAVIANVDVQLGSDNAGVDAAACQALASAQSAEGGETRPASGGTATTGAGGLEYATNTAAGAAMRTSSGAAVPGRSAAAWGVGGAVGAAVAAAAVAGLV